MPSHTLSLYFGKTFKQLADVVALLAVPDNQAPILLHDVPLVETTIMFNLGFVGVVVQIENPTCAQYGKCLIDASQRLGCMVQGILYDDEVGTILGTAGREVFHHTELDGRNRTMMTTGNTIEIRSQWVNIVNVEWTTFPVCLYKISGGETQSCPHIIDTR